MEDALFNNVLENKIDSWAYLWNLCLWYNGKVVLTPKYNLVKNIGYGNSATHTFVKGDNLNYKTTKLNFPYLPPINDKINIIADNYVFYNIEIKSTSYCSIPSVIAICKFFCDVFML